MRVAQRPVSRSTAARRPSASSGAGGRRSGGSAVPTVVWLMVVSAIAGLIVGVGGSELFAVREVQVACENESLQVEAAERARNLHFGTVWLPPTRTIERRIGGLPRARRVGISRELPSTLTIVVEPRTPNAAVAQADRFMAIDDQGVCLHWTGSPPETMPTVMIEGPATLEVGRTLPERETQSIRQIMSGLEETELLEGATIDLSHLLAISVVTSDGVIGKLGNEELLHEKTVLFGRLLTRLRETGEAPLYIDLRVPARPSYRPAE